MTKIIKELLNELEMKNLETVLAFCQRHDWGQDACIRRGNVAGLRDRYTLAGEFWDTEISFNELGGTMRALKSWAGY